MSEQLNIYQRVNEIRKKVWYAKKDKEVKGQGYRGVTHDYVTAMVRNHLIDFGVVIVPSLVSSSVESVGKTKTGAIVIRYAARYDVTFVNCDKPDDVIVIPVESHGNDHGDKAPGKTISYAVKYAMLKLFNIETGEEDESRVEPYAAREHITDEQATELRVLVEETGADEEKLLAFAKADSFDEISALKFDHVRKMLLAKRKKAEAKDA